MFSADLGVTPTAAAPTNDPNFKQVALLLHGDGTNGAQNNTFVDGSTNNFTITRTGNVAQGTFSPFSLPEGQWSNYFDGSGDYLTVPDNVALQLPTQDFTIECWMYLNALPTASNAAALLNKGRTDTSNFEYQLVAYNNGSNTIIRAGYGTTGPDLTVAVDSGTNYVSANTWYHVALTRSGTTAKLWINGVNVGTTTSWTSTQYSGSGALGIGANNAGAGAITGYISNLRIVKGSAVYTSNFTPPTSPLTAITNTSLLTCQSNRFKDNSSNNFTITPAGDTKVTAFSPFAPSAAYDASTNGGSAYFDGSGDYLTIPSSTALQAPTEDFTIEAFVYITTLTGTQTILQKGIQGTTTFEYGFYYDTGSMRFYSSANGSSIDQCSAAFVPIANQWNHFAVTRSGTSVKFFANGLQVSSATIGYSTLFAGTGTLSIGMNNTGAANPVYGYLSNVRFVKGSLVYTGSYTVPTAPLTAITNTQLLLNCTNAGIIDNAGKNDIETVGNAQISTSVKKYGTGSMYFDGTGDYLRYISTPDTTFGTGDFTIEGWVYSNSISSTQVVFVRRSATAARGIISYFDSSKLAFRAGDTSTAAWEVSIDSGTLSSSTWYHFALTRSGNAWRAFVNGTQVGSTITWSGSVVDETSNWIIGANNNGTSALNGYIDDLRITKGQALYTANFTPPTQAFPNV